MPKEPSPSLAFVPNDARYPELVRAVQHCKACDLYKRATSAVFGEGPVAASLVLVGEQPGDQEDKTGHPFVGPAGRVLDAALAEASIPRDQIYLTNAVKHFKWEPRGKRRIHSKPNAAEMHACHGWLEAELSLIEPRVVVCLGATAAQALLGRAFKLTQNRGRVVTGTPWAPSIIATYHPSALLRMMHDEEAYANAKAELTTDLAKAGSLAGFAKKAPRGAAAAKRRSRSRTEGEQRAR